MNTLTKEEATILAINSIPEKNMENFEIADFYPGEEAPYDLIESLTSRGLLCTWYDSDDDYDYWDTTPAGKMALAIYWASNENVQ